MKVNIVCVGSIKEKYYSDACDEYMKRLQKFCKINIIEIDEEKLPKNANIGDIERVKTLESERIEKHLKGHVVLLDVLGKEYTSEGLSDKIEKLQNTTSCITFVIGGSYGVSESLKRKTLDKLSFSKFTFPHQLMRVILLEQLYRAYTISNNITYHK